MCLYLKGFTNKHQGLPRKDEIRTSEIMHFKCPFITPKLEKAEVKTGLKFLKFKSKLTVNHY